MLPHMHLCSKHFLFAPSWSIVIPVSSKGGASYHMELWFSCPKLAPFLAQPEGPTGSVKQLHYITNNIFFQECNKIIQTPLIYPDYAQNTSSR